MFVNLFRVDVLLTSFGGYWSVWPVLLGKLFRKPSFIILHGTDCASIPELNYGSLRLPLLKWACKISYQHASRLLPVSESLGNVFLDFDPVLIHKSQGIHYHFRDIKTPVTAVYNGFDHKLWPYEAFTKKPPNTFLAVMSAAQYRLKGGDIIEEIAWLRPDLDFKIAGLNALQKPLPPNLQFLGKLSQQELSNAYRSSRYYLQLSTFEGFGCALAEAMLSGCIPIGSSANHIPKIIAGNGLILQKKDRTMLLQAIQQLLSLSKPEEISRKARRHIIKNYSLTRRKETLSTLLNNYEQPN
ncbi:glycosyltransferase family 4 protein [Cyclobacterium lianum]|uniref:glycosyltransferase family 4 protein n=1 Tax=Cyclobacterium lianum TaxID=388280 RepID=UPI001FE3C1EB|nr:glycosyltransferase family 4 protein [Cyclobacterium lianum]